MEPGHEDREYAAASISLSDHGVASMEPGHEDREYTCLADGSRSRLISLNGARP